MIQRSPYSNVDIPMASLPEFVTGRFADFGDKPAMIDGPSGRQVSYRELERQIRACAAGLAGRGFGKGDVFAIFSPNLPEYAVAFHGVALAGGIVTTANPLYTARELAGQLRDAGARYLVTIPPFLDTARQAGAEAGIDELFVFGTADGATPFSDLLDFDAEPPQVEIDPAKDLTVLPYSSGTTGLPKGVMLTHRNLVANMVQCEGFQGLDLIRHDDVVLGVLPFFHIYGMLVIMNLSLKSGATVVTMPRFDLEQFLGLIEQHRVTKVYVVPPIVVALGKHPAVDNYDLSSLDVIFSGAAPLGESLAQEVARRLDCDLVQGYGLTETSPVTHVSPANPEVRASIGYPLPNTEVVVADLETGRPLGPDEQGEVWVRGPQVMAGYLNNPQATAETVDADGWLHTGDVGYYDAAGRFYVVDRVKELIKYNAYQVAPAELEALLLAHPAVGDVAVIPCPDEEAGEIPKACVVLSGEVTAEELMEWVAGQVAPQKRVRRVEFIDQVPKSLSGKILRRELIERERGAVTPGPA